jgi:hypothetical protein
MAAGSLPDLPDQQTPTMPPIQGAPPTAPPQAQPQTPGGPPSLTPPAQGGIAQGTGNTKGEVPTPDVELKFKPDKLAKATTTLDVLNAATAASRKEYMDWWQKQHGDIDDKYDHLKSQLGARPSDDEPQTKKEKFAALLEFGLHLMKNSAAPSTNQGAALTSTLSDEHDAMTKAHQADISGRQGAYDAQAQAIESARDKEQAGIGTPAAAMKASDDQAKTAAAATKDQAGALKDLSSADETKASSLGAPTYAVGPGGVIHSLSRDADGKAHAEPVTGIDGKPFQGRVLGRTTGSGVDKEGQDPAAVRTYKYATGVLGMDKNTAAPILGIKPTGKPQADHAAVYKAVMTATLGDDEKAKRVSDQYVLDNYGAGALARANAPPLPEMPPPEALKGLVAGKVRDFGEKGKWTLGINGQPRRVPDGPTTIQ